jgi:hypothetical protein
MISRTIAIVGLATLALVASAAPSPADQTVPLDSDSPSNLAAGRPVLFAPAPSGSGRGGADASRKLTNGKVVERPDNEIWHDPEAVNWESIPKAALQLDLGSAVAIDEVSIRFVGGSPQPGVEFPVFVKLLASVDGKDWYLLSDYDSHRPGDDQKFHVPATHGKAWVHELRFTGLSTQVKFVGVELGATGLTSADEMRVVPAPSGSACRELPRESRVDGAPVPDRQPRIVAIRDELTVSSDVSLPQPVLLLDELGEARSGVLSVHVPPGLLLQGLDLGEQGLRPRTATRASDGGTKFEFDCKLSGASVIPWACLWLKGDALQPDCIREISISIDVGGGIPRNTILQCRSRQFLPAPKCKKLMLSLGWWRLRRTMRWPQGIAAARTIGINTLSAMEGEVGPNDTDLQEMLASAKAAGFWLQNIDSPFNRMMNNYPAETDLRCRGSDGKVLSDYMCPSYRGPRYQQELQRIAVNVALCQPNFFSADIELWDWRGAYAAEQCARCIADKATSAISTWKEWRTAKGEQMWRDLQSRVQSAAKATSGRELTIGAYDFRPHVDYQGVWPFDRLFVQGLLHGPETSIYTPLRPYHLRLLGDTSRADRNALPRSCGMPWLTPGDNGIVDAERFRCAMLELFFAGTIGINFWSDRYWDGEVLLGYNQAVRAVQPVEDVITLGHPFTGVSTSAPGRTVAMATDDVITVLAADYDSQTPGALDVEIVLPWKCEAKDAETGNDLGALDAGKRNLRVPLGSHRSTVLQFRRSR